MAKVIPTLKVLLVTKRQQEYIEILANELNFDLTRRKAAIYQITGIETGFLDELLCSQASKVIATFIKWKDNVDKSIKSNQISDE